MMIEVIDDKPWVCAGGSDGAGQQGDESCSEKGCKITHRSEQQL
jgi:ABC-type uncharacterized transport system substrate-binding protein